MNSIDKPALAALASHRGFPCVSMSLPLSGKEPDKRPGMLRLKNLISQASGTLAAEGLRQPQARELLAEATALLDDPAFWEDSAKGLAVYSRPGLTRIYRLDTPLPEHCVVGGRFYLRPLALAIHGDESLFALALDRSRARLFSANRTDIVEIHLDPAVSSFAETTKYDQREESLQLTTFASPGSSAGVGRGIGLFHGHAGENVDKDELLRFSTVLERAVTDHIGPDSTAPLLLLGVGYQLAAYRAVNTYRSIAPQQVEGATDELAMSDIHAKARDALKPLFSLAVEDDVAELQGKRAELVATDPVQIVNAAATGRVKTLFFDDSVGPFGQFDRTRFSVSIVCDGVPRQLRESTESSDPECGWDLVDLAMAETVMHGGTVRAFTGESAPITGAAAILRY
jgi:hypothetical protein